MYSVVKRTDQILILVEIEKNLYRSHALILELVNLFHSRSAVALAYSGEIAFVGFYSEPDSPIG